MTSTIAFYTGDGATTDFTVPFDYLAKKFVRVSLGVTILKGGDYGDTSKDYYFLDKTKVRLKVPPQEGEVLTIRRYTSATDRVVSFKDASVLKATDLEVSSLQTIHIAEEARDIINDALIKDKKDNWDAKGNRIVNVGTPEADSDAMTYGVYMSDALGASQSKLDAERARDRAVEAETNSKKSEENAKLSEVNAQASAGTAVSAAKHADTVMAENQAILQEAKEIRDENKVLDANTKDNANVAQVKANEAKVSEVNAKASEVEAKKQADIAEQYAYQAAAGQLQADWAQTNSTKSGFIKNKPTLGTLSAKNSLAYSELTGVPSSFTPSSHTHPISQITNLQVDLTAIRESITNVSSKVDGIGDTLSPTSAKKQAILDACDKALNGTNPVNAVDPTFINQLAEKLSKLATIRPLGFHYLHPYGTVPADSIICNGVTYSRALYKDFFDYITTQGWVKTEAEWQEIATRDNGFCPFYSSGDGSTNFRTPTFAPYQQIARGVAQTTKYHQAGLPNITGYWNTRGPETLENSSGGALISEVSSDRYGYGHQMGSPSVNLKIDASRSSPVYGRSSTVQPELHEWVVCVVAYGIATNVGSVDIQNVMPAVNAVQANLTQIESDIAQIPQPRTYVTKTWSSETEWYRVWSDGWIEQGGHGIDSVCTFSKPFSNKNYTFNVQPSNGYTDHPDWIAAYENRDSRTTTGTGITWIDGGDRGWDWRASGY